MALPSTTEGDLRLMGITPEAIGDAIRRSGHQIDGDIVGYFLPEDGWSGHPNIRRARNNLKSDWRAIGTDPPDTVKEEEYNESFANFDGDSPLTVTFEHTVEIITAEDYTQTQRFEVSVNANIPLGQSGALVGFNAAMSAEEVKHKSKTETDHRDNKFDLTVPAGEGRKVTEKTTVTSITTRYEGALRTEGSVGIEVNPGIWWSNVFWWYDNIEAVFPNAEATSHITRSSTNTNIDTKILKMPKPTDGREARRMEYFRFFTSDIAVVGFMGPGIAVSTIVKDNPPHRSPFLASMKIEVRFSGVVGAGVVGPEVPLEIRRSNTEEFKALILTNVHAIGNPGAITYASKFGSASFFIPYDPQKITYVELGEAVIKQAHGIRWRGHYMIYFS